MERIGIVCALYFEASAFTAGKPPAQQPVELNAKTLLIVSGMGRERARQAARRLAEENAGRLVSFGSAGALSPELRPGDLVQAQRVHEAGREYAASAALPAAVVERLSRKNVTVHTGALAHSEEPVADSNAKLALFERTGALAVDMESAGVLEAAERGGLPACVLRVITDPADMTLPAAALRRVDDFGEADVMGLGIDLATSPGQIPALLRLACASRRAAGTMKLVAQALLRPQSGACQNSRTGL